MVMTGGAGKLVAAHWRTVVLGWSGKGVGGVWEGRKKKNGG